MEELTTTVSQVAGTAASIIEALAILIVAFAIVGAFIAYIASQLRSGTGIVSIRIGLGKTLALALEFLLAADIVETAVAPSWEEIGKLAAIATLRTLLNFFLEREIAREENRRRDAGVKPI